MLELQKIKIGWIICYIRETKPEVRLFRYFRCMGFGHIAKAYTEKDDKSSFCFKCGDKIKIVQLNLNQQRRCKTFSAYMFGSKRWALHCYTNSTRT